VLINVKIDSEKTGAGNAQSKSENSLSLSLSQLVIKSTVGMSFFLTLAFNAMFLTNENRARIANEGATISRNVLRY